MKKILLIFYVFYATLSFSQQNEGYFYVQISNNETLNYKVDDNGYVKIKISDIEKYLSNYVVYYENNGYPFAEVKLENIEENTAELVVNKGEDYTVDSLVIYGNSKLTEKQLFKLIGIEKGEIYKQEKLDKIDDKISNIGYLKQTKEQSSVFYKNTTHIYFYLEKVKNNFIDGIIGFSASEEEIKLNGYVNTKLKNTLNYGEEIDINWRSEQDKFQKLESSVTTTHLYKNIGAAYNLDIYRQYENFSNTNYELSILKSKNRNQFGISFQSKQSVSEQSEQQNTETKNIGIKYQFQNRNTHLIGSSYFGNRKTENNIHPYQEYSLEAIYSYPFSDRLYSSFNNISKIIISENLQDSELLFFGGASSLNGFKEDQFKVNNYNLSSININYDLDKSSSTNIFFQQAYYESEEIQKWAHSVGIGFDLKSKSGTIYLKYAVGFNQQQEFNMENGIIHIGVKNTF